MCEFKVDCDLDKAPELINEIEIAVNQAATFVKTKQEDRREHECKREIRQTIGAAGGRNARAKADRRTGKNGILNGPYAGLDSRMLSALLEKQDIMLKKLTGKLRSSRQRLAALHMCVHRAVGKWKSVRRQHRRTKPNKKSKSDQYHAGRANRNVSSWGGATMSLMKAVSFGSAWKVGASLQTDASAQTVNRWDCNTNAALLCGAKSWYKHNETKLQAPPPGNNCFNYVVHSIRSDGTNGKILHKEA